MAGLLVRREREERPIPRIREFDPFEWVRDIMASDPFRGMSLLPPIDRETAFVPAFEVKETKEGIVFKADMPGVKEANLEVSLSGNRLTIAGSRETEEEEKKAEQYYTYERSYGTFSRTFTLPDGVDTEHVHADLKNGVLTLIVEKKPELQPRKIEVKTTKS